MSHCTKIPLRSPNREAASNARSAYYDKITSLHVFTTNPLRVLRKSSVSRVKYHPCSLGWSQRYSEERADAEYKACSFNTFSECAGVIGGLTDLSIP